LTSICLPVLLESLDGSAFACANIGMMSLESGNLYLSLLSDFLLNSTGMNLIRYIGVGQDITILSSIEVFGANCFYGSTTLSILLFAADSKLREIGICSFYECTSLKSICIPSSVTILCRSCFHSCKSLSTLNFETGSKLTEIGVYSFADCSLLRSVCIPASVCILGGFCFSSCRSLSRLTFESGSRLAWIDEFAFALCSALKSICIPPSVETVVRGCFYQCTSLSNGTFAPGSKLTASEQSLAFAPWPKQRRDGSISEEDASALNRLFPGIELNFWNEDPDDPKASDPLSNFPFSRERRMWSKFS
jgi:hypothetical protein